MVERNSKSKKFIDNLLNFQDVKDLELCDDQGVKVSTHTYDVLNISINKIKEKYIGLEEATETTAVKSSNKKLIFLQSLWE